MSRNILLAHGEFEPDNVALTRAEFREGQAVLDIGANEGFFSAVLGRLVGPRGKVIAVEPQVRSRPIIEANLALNQVESHVILSHAVGLEDGETGEMSLYPAIDSGASSLVRCLRFFRHTQPVSFMAPERILEIADVECIDFVKPGRKRRGNCSQARFTISCHKRLWTFSRGNPYFSTSHPG